MKTINYLFAFLSFITFSVHAQVPNGGFEMGYNVDSSLKHWWNNNVYSIGINDSILYDGPWISYSTNSYAGMYALELRSSYNVTQNSGHELRVACYSDSTMIGFGTTAFFPILNKPNSLSFYAKMSQNPFNDTVECKVRILNSDFFEIGESVLKLWTVNSVYQLTTMPIQYIPTSAIGLGDSIPAFGAIVYKTIITTTVPHVGMRFLTDEISFNSSPTGVVNLEKDTHMTISPNPVQSHFSIVSSSTILSASIHDGIGRKIKEQKANFERVDCSHLPEGIYFVQVKTFDGTQTIKLIVAK